MPINFDSLNLFCAEFLNGKLKSKAEADYFAARALQFHISSRNTVERKQPKKQVPIERGIAESFDAAFDQRGLVAVVTPENFEETVMQENVDVLLLLHSRGCESCAHFAVFFKRVAERFADLAIPSLRIARMDVTDATPPARLNLLGHGNLPSLVMLPAFGKHEPWSFYSGVGKPQEIMRWVASQAAIPFTLPNLPHLNEEQRVLYKEQIREREEYLDAVAREEEEQRDIEEEAQRQFLSAQRKKELSDSEVEGMHALDSDRSNEL